MTYTATALEDWITTNYSHQHIKTPQDINLTRIARWHHIYIHYREMPARYDIFGRFKCIVVDKRVSLEEQREQFFHELCHILRHAGHQSMLPEAFRELQEWDANRFVMYAALPYSMVTKYDFENPYLIQDLAYDFKVTEGLCKKRMEQIKRNLLSNQMIVAEQKSYV
ncbi:ImmA/IrrE family metallo-endopeptidase [Virgibacillus halophilus]|uniref:ImmA/IrrE family metallo-endopeptidase n=1 Tax=Tigheibacillus halophilus TaxID=361280 RepID=A0ABU5CDB0_9BACI|nr:ImmA/IrrE family metallo-endopeptidase [Virgibacillus halophilus]